MPGPYTCAVPTVSRLAIAPVKGLALSHPEEVVVTPTGVPENRRFYLVDERGKLVSGTRPGPLFQVTAETDPEGDRLVLRFPDGRVIDEPVRVGSALVTPFWDRPVRGHRVEGPWADALSDFLGKRVDLHRADEPGGGFDDSPVSLLSEASLEALAQRVGEERVDGRRFRMLIHVEGCEPLEEESWIGRRLAIGETVVRATKHDARCNMTTRNPDSGVRDFDTLGAIRDLRGLRNGKHLDFGIYADVEQPGRVRVGDPIEPL
jgi:uncharacterized protein